MKRKIDIYVTGSVVCDRCEAREQTPAVAENPGGSREPRRYGVVTCLAGLQPSDEFDLSAAVIIDGDLDVRSLSHSGNVLVGGVFAIREEGGYDGSR